MKVRALLHVLLPLVIGAVVYVVWRAEAVRLVTWLPPGSVRAMKSGLGSISLPAIIVGSASDAAWGWSFGAALALVWRDRPSRARTFWLVSGGVVAAYAEIGQLWGFPPGTFDWADLIAIVGAYVAGALIAGRTSRSLQEPKLGDPRGGDPGVASVIER